MIVVATSSSLLLPPAAALFFDHAIPGIDWPLDPGLTPPLYYESMEQMRAIRASSSSASPSTSSLLEFLRDIPGTVETLFPWRSSLLGAAAAGGDDADQEKQDDDERYCFGLISMALVLLGHGYTDECHNLITPLSWPDDLHFAYGPSVYAKVSLAARSYATYVHALVHRREAFHVGEFGMVGFQNGNFWSNAVAKSPGVDSLPHADLLSHVGKLAEEEDYRDCPLVQEWCNRHGIMANEQESQLASSSSFSSSSSSWPFFESRAVHQLCATVLQQQLQKSSSTTSTSNDMDQDKRQLKEFAEQVAESEIRILLAHSLERAGFGQVDTMRRRHQASTPSVTTKIASSPTTTKVMVDVDIAIGAARRVSSAHLGIFQSTGAVTVRRVLGHHDDIDNLDKATTTTVLLSAATGLACRLLEMPACRLVAQNELLDGIDGDIVEIVVSSGKSIGHGDHGGGNAAGGGDLARGDVLARRLNNAAPRGQCSASYTLLRGGDSSSYIFTAALVDDHAAVFVDPLFGSRGVTPTTVVEWSKGTIHYSTQEKTD